MSIIIIKFYVTRLAGSDIRVLVMHNIGLYLKSDKSKNDEITFYVPNSLDSF